MEVTVISIVIGVLDTVNKWLVKRLIYLFPFFHLFDIYFFFLSFFKFFLLVLHLSSFHCFFLSFLFSFFLPFSFFLLDFLFCLSFMKINSMDSTRPLISKRTSGVYPDYSVKIGQNTKKSPGDLRKPEETCSHSNSSKNPSAKEAVKNSEKSKIMIIMIMINTGIQRLSTV